MPDTNDGPDDTVTDTDATSASSEPLPGFAEAMTMLPPEPGRGEPEVSKAVETSAEAKAPEAKADTPAKEPAKAEEKPSAAKTVNFDDFSEGSKAYWEKALAAGHATPADVERARVETLFQRSWTKNHQKLADERKAFEAEKARMKEDVELLTKIRGDDRLHAAWLKMSKGEIAEASADGGELVDERKAAEIVRKTIEAREAEQAARSAKEQAAYDTKRDAIQEAVREQMRILGVKPEVMKGYLEAEEATLNGADPILTLAPMELVERVQRRHDRAVLEAEVKSLKEQLSQRASKAVQASKQSLPPSSRVAPTRSADPWSKALSDLGVAEDFGNVTGFGNGVHR